MFNNFSNKSRSNSVLKVYLINQDEIQTHEKKSVFEIAKFNGGYKQVLVLPESNQAFLGLSLGSKFKHYDPYHKVNFFELGVSLVRAVEKYSYTGFEIKSFPRVYENDASNFVLGIKQAGWYFDDYLGEKAKKSKEYSVEFAGDLKKIFKPTSEQLTNVLHEASLATRRMIDDTPENINPETIPLIVKRTLAPFQDGGLDINVYDAHGIDKIGMNGVLQVGRASRFQPSFVHVRIKPRNKAKKTICLVGKGVTFDSGGYNLKPDGGHTMKGDMAGAATMFGVTRALAEIGLENVEVHWFSAFVENMIDGSGYKPDDIITSLSGQTIEVLNTDAEGRLTLADLLTYATLFNPDYIVDAATLTGASIVALSDHFTALMGNDKNLVDSLLQKFVQEGEPTLEVLMPEVLRGYVNGTITDLINTSNLPKKAGHITAGLFLSHFVDQRLFRNENLKITEPKAYPWVHLDIAPTAFNEGKNQLQTRFATAQSVRTLVKWILDQDGQNT